MQYTAWFEESTHIASHVKISESVSLPTSLIAAYGKPHQRQMPALGLERRV